jgi:predicted transcriptional regulator
MSNKEIVHDVPQRVPDDTSLDDSAYELEFIAAVRQGLAELDNGQSVSVEEIEHDLSSWRIKYDSHILPEQT